MPSLNRDRRSGSIEDSGFAQRERLSWTLPYETGIKSTEKEGQ
jgi:hypothetical protein